MGQPLVPAAGHAQLRGAGVRGQARHRVAVGGGGCGGEPPGVGQLGRRDGPNGVLDLPLDPDLGQPGGTPVGEHAHAVAAGGDGAEVVVEHLERKALVHPLADVEGRHHLQDQAGDHAQRPQVDHGAGKRVIGAGDFHQVAVRGDDLHGGDGRGQALVGRTRAVGGGRTGSGYRDMRQGRQVAQREAPGVQAAGQLGVAQARRHPDQARGRVNLHLGGQVRQVDLGTGGIGHVVERMTGGQHLDLAGPGDDPPELADGGRAVEIGRAVDDIAGPVRPRRIHVQVHARHPTVSLSFPPHPPADPPVLAANLRGVPNQLPGLPRKDQS